MEYSGMIITWWIFFSHVNDPLANHDFSSLHRQETETNLLAVGSKSLEEIRSANEYTMIVYFQFGIRSSSISTKAFYRELEGQVIMQFMLEVGNYLAAWEGLWVLLWRTFIFLWRGLRQNFGWMRENRHITMCLPDITSDCLLPGCRVEHWPSVEGGSPSASEDGNMEVGLCIHGYVCMSFDCKLQTSEFFFVL